MAACSDRGRYQSWTSFYLVRPGECRKPCSAAGNCRTNILITNTTALGGVQGLNKESLL